MFDNAAGNPYKEDRMLRVEQKILEDPAPLASYAKYEES